MMIHLNLQRVSGSCLSLILRDKFKAKSVDVTSANPCLSELLSNQSIPLGDVFSYLSESSDARQIYYSNEQEVADVLLFNPKDNDYCYYLKSITADLYSHIQILSISREGLHSSLECKHLNDIVNSILFVMWKYQ
jgi:hypothetical protein